MLEIYSPVPPTDQMMDIRTEMMLTMIQCGIDVEAQHHEVASAGQCEIDMRYQSLVRMADHLCLYKYIVRHQISNTELSEWRTDSFYFTKQNMLCIILFFCLSLLKNTDILK